jgi:hypothetical protein
MKAGETLTNDNFVLFAAQNYYSLDREEFNTDLKRFKYIKRLFNRYEDTGKLSERLILNHLIVLFNVFSVKPALKMLELRIDSRHWTVLKPYLIFLGTISNDEYTGISQDKAVVSALREI